MKSRAAVARRNAFTWIDCTAYYLTLPSARSPGAGDRAPIASTTRASSPEEAEAERTRRHLQREGSENYPEFRLREEVQAAAWREHLRLGA